MRNIFRLFFEDKIRLIFLLLLLIFTTVVSLALPMIMSLIVDNGIHKSDYNYIIYACIVMTAISAAGFAAQLISVRLSVKIANNFNYKLRERTFKKTQELTFEQFDKTGIASLVNRSTNDPNNMSWFFISFINAIFIMPIIIVTATLLSFKKDIYLSLIMFAFTPVVMLISYIIIKKIRPLIKKSDECIDMQNGSMRERILGIRIVRAFNKEDTEHKKISDNTMTMARAIIASNRRASVMHPLIILILNIITVLILFVGSKRIGNPDSILSVGDISAIIQYVSLAMGAIVSSAYTLIGLPRVIESLKRINEVICVNNNAESGQSDKIKFSGAVKLENVSFCYPGAAANTLKKINMNIETGSKIALIGGTGSGKTTLAKVIMGFYKPTDGNIMFDDYSVSDLKPKTIRENLSISMQKAAVFSGTVRENIQMGKDGASDAELDTVTDIAQIKDFIFSKSQNYDYYLEQAGANLSGGQKQRLSLARTIIKDASVYIFDDTFSALDYMTEARIRKKLNEYLNGKTQIIITQRVASAKNCDCIYVIDKGEIIASGTHAALMESCRNYKEIYISQTGGAL